MDVDAGVHPHIAVRHPKMPAKQASPSSVIDDDDTDNEVDVRDLSVSLKRDHEQQIALSKR